MPRIDASDAAGHAAMPTWLMLLIAAAWFALAGVAGAIAAPISGRVADRGWTRPATAFCMLPGLLSFVPTLGAEVRGRVNGLYMATFFLGGATGSALGAWSFAHGGWRAACAVGMGLIGAVFLVFLSESSASTGNPRPQSPS